MTMDYDDKSSEGYKAQIARDFESMLTVDTKALAAVNLRKLMSQTVVDGYLDRVRGSLSALPQEIRVAGETRSLPKIFEDVKSAAVFLQGESLTFSFPANADKFVYEVTYSDGFEFSRQNLTLATIRELHREITLLDAHMRAITAIH